jgi:ABC-type multidrug transport system permease subunit
MKIALNVVGVILLIFGSVWFLQGINKFPGNSFMNGQTQWSIYGGIAFAAGVAALIVANRKRKAA